MKHAARLVPSRYVPAARTMKRSVSNAFAKSPLGAAVEAKKWADRCYDMPAPQMVKWSVLTRYGHPLGTWVETGTYLGETTAFLAGSANHVYSLEPMPDLAQAAVERFGGIANVTIIQGLSEDCLPEILDGIAGPVSFWLDGHFSKGNTFQGPSDTPIRAELAAIEPHLPRWDSVTVLVDDVRCFDPSNPNFADYPTRGWLVDWAERNNLNWLIEHDIFVARR
ncbi:MAG: class I SAM-dependent methyltransferase [Actinomycetota bacterium]|nr:class I SAM-dependent methyltransferase [Actinomycetota bacterium]